MRLPGSIAEIDASPEGARIGAFFDVDGTLVAGFTAAVHAREGLRDMGVRDMARMLKTSLDYKLGRSDFDALVTSGTESLQGRRADEIEELGERLFQQFIADIMYPEMRDIVRAHQRRGHTVALSSSAMPNQIEPIAAYLGIDDVICNRQVIDDAGLLTGEVVRPIIWGPGKSMAVQKFAAERGVNLVNSYFYADGDEDLPLMYAVGHPRPTNPGPALTRVAQKRGWPILRFTSRGGGGAARRLRSTASMASVVPIGVAALGLGLLTRNRRRGLNMLFSRWPAAILSINGVTVNVAGAEHLEKARPAVIIFNHRTNFDAFMVASIVKSDFTGVAKKELESDPIMGTIGRLMDVAFVDRANSPGSAAALSGVQELLSKGISVVIAPEGTRLDTETVGDFKMGAFNIAFATQTPIVPIVIRNADSVAGRNATSMNPGTVDIAVLPPVSVADWKSDNLKQHRDEVRELFVRTLEDWPASSGLQQPE
jgi:putative phosphoserine phosphatase/1-acylglycerol-3-phosphate O-acyltransferase